jgi:hypothetical protein
MRRTSFALAALLVAGLVALLPGCSNSNTPQVAAIAMHLSTQLSAGADAVEVAITAQVLSDGGPIADGTMVTFETDNGSFAGGGLKVIEATQGGYATATITVAKPDIAHVSVSVEDVASALTIDAGAVSVSTST